jgi:hypothetical protein
LKQNLNVKHFFGTSSNAVSSQIWSAICAYLLVLIVHRKLQLHIKPHTLMHLLETSLFERIPIAELVQRASFSEDDARSITQEELF